MNWEELTAPEFKKAIEICERVCVIPIGVIEKHGDHLPLGTDAIKARHSACMAAELEPFMVFPFFYFGQNTHAKSEPGAIALKFELMLPFLESICDEIARNGFTKIILFSSHGGNVNFLKSFCELMLDREHPYTVIYAYAGVFRAGNTVCEAKYDGHGGEFETSMILGCRPDLVKGQPGDYGMPLKREKAFEDMRVHTPTQWYANHPGMLSSDGVPGSVEKGNVLIQMEAEGLARLVRLVKSDDTPERLYREFHQRCREVGNIQ